MSTLLPLEDWAESIGETPRWARDHVRSGDILAIKIGSRYFLTPELVAAMSARAIPAAAAEPVGSGWEQITRGAS